MSRLLIKNGTVVTPDSVFRGDILVNGETIEQVGTGLAAPDAETLDAGGLHILPGAIDAHVHLRDPGAIQKEDFTTGTRAALGGGVTTILDMPNNPRPTTTPQAIDEKRAIAAAKAVCDYGLFAGATVDNTGSIGTMDAIGVKVYMGATTGDLLVTDFASEYLHFGAAHRLPIVVHAEDNEALKYFGADSTRTHHSDRRPPIAASVAVARAIALCEATGRQLHIAHLSTAAELYLVHAAKERGLAVTCEVTPQHLFLTTDDEERLGPFGIVNPPLRSPEDVQALWHNRSAWDIVATDHAPHTVEEKNTTRPSGMPGLETMLPLLLDAASAGRLSLQDVTRLTSRTPARIFHLEHKGETTPGYDADLTLVRLDEEYVLERPWQTKCNWSPFEGRRVRGKIVNVFLRGQRVVQEGRVVAEPGTGKKVTRAQ